MRDTNIKDDLSQLSNLWIIARRVSISVLIVLDLLLGLVFKQLEETRDLLRFVERDREKNGPTTIVNILVRRSDHVDQFDDLLLLAGGTNHTESISFTEGVLQVQTRTDTFQSSINHNSDPVSETVGLFHSVCG